MDWWQIVLVILTSIGIGLLVGYLLSYLIVTRVLKKPFAMPFVKRATAIAVEEQLKSIAPDLFTELIEKRVAIERQAKEQAKRVAEEARRVRGAEERARKEAERQAKEQTKRAAEEAKKVREAEERARMEAATVKEPPKVIMPDLVAEIENNRRIATEPRTGKLLPFQTGVWDTSPDEVHTLPANLQEDLTQAYADIRLANSIVWLATELGRRSSNLDENYMKLCTNIAARLGVITPLLKRSGD